jgi:hypothetical protein
MLIVGYLLIHDDFTGRRVLFGIAFALVMEAVEYYRSAVWYFQAMKAHDWDISVLIPGLKQKGPILAVTCRVDEAYILLHLLSRVQKYARFFRERTWGFKEVMRPAVPWALKLGVVALDSFRPFLTAFCLLVALVTKVAFGQTIGAGMKLDLRSPEKRPPISWIAS